MRFYSQVIGSPHIHFPHTIRTQVCRYGHRLAAGILLALVPRGRPLAYGIAGAAILILYGLIPTYQTAPRGQVY